MSTAVVEGLPGSGRKALLAVATAYNEEARSELLRVFLQGIGLRGPYRKGDVGIEKIGVAGTVSQDDLHKFVVGVAEKAPKADAMLVSCGGLRTLELIAPLEKDCKMPAWFPACPACTEGRGSAGWIEGYRALGVWNAIVEGSIRGLFPVIRLVAIVLAVRSFTVAVRQTRRTAFWVSMRPGASRCSSATHQYLKSASQAERLCHGCDSLAEQAFSLLLSTWYPAVPGTRSRSGRSLLAFASKG